MARDFTFREQSVRHALTVLAASGGLLYAAPWLLDVSNTNAVARLPDPFGPADHVLAAVGDYAYVRPSDKDRPHELDVFDMSDPQQPRRVAEIATDAYPGELTVVGDVGVLAGAHFGGCPVVTTIDLMRLPRLGNEPIPSPGRTGRPPDVA